MYLKKISLFNYKNFSEANFEFEGKIICFVGKNGIGKTNVLDAIYHLSFGKSYFNPVASQNIKHDKVKVTSFNGYDAIIYKLDETNTLTVKSPVKALVNEVAKPKTKVGLGL